jgi:hypothetical protein
VEKSIPSRPVSAKIFLVFMESEYPEREYKIKKNDIKSLTGTHKYASRIIIGVVCCEPG